MTTELCEHYLKYAFENRSKTECFFNHKNSNKIAVIIEPRFDNITEHVIYNFMHFLNPLGFNLVVISYSGYHKIIETKLPYAFVFDINEKHIEIDSAGIPNISIASYNAILMNPEFWQILPGETVLIFQRDCIMFRPFSDHYLLYDYAGANYYSNLSPLFGGINGGFSIRNREVMLECLQNVSWDNIANYRKYHSMTEEITAIHEDVFFTHACEILRKIVPDKYTRTFLCIETDMNEIAAVHHGWNKDYITRDHLCRLFELSPLFSSIKIPFHQTKICFITAIYGNYELSCKPFIKQTEKTDFFCFTDNPNIAKNGWTIDTTPYHIHCKNYMDDGEFINSIQNNKHTFNIAKYYKQSFRFIPALKKYDVVVWIDGTVEITYERTSEYILNQIYDKKIIGWHHEYREGILKNEVDASSDFYRYNSTFWNGQSQPLQDVNLQYREYLEDGYSESFFREMQPENPHFGVWLTCFVAFLMTNSEVVKFLDLWYLQTLKYTTQDQIGFPYVCQKTNLIPYTLPNEEVRGEFPHQTTDFYIKHDHGK
jgi:hypothetical protein